MAETVPILRHWILLKMLCARGQGRTLRELAAETGCSQKTIYRDLLLLRRVGFAVEEAKSDHGRKHWLIRQPAGVPALSFTLTATAVPTLPTGGEPPRRPTDAPPSEGKNRTLYLGGAGVAAGAAAVAGLWWASRQSELSECRDANTSPTEICNNESTLRKQRNAAMAGTLVLAGTAVTLAVIGLLQSPGEEQTTRNATGTRGQLACLPGPGAVSCALSF